MGPGHPLLLTELSGDNIIASCRNALAEMFLQFGTCPRIQGLYTAQCGFLELLASRDIWLHDQGVARCWQPTDAGTGAVETTESLIDSCECCI